MTRVMEIVGNLRDRFVQAAVLLQMLDPVREESTELHTLDQDLGISGIGADREKFLKRKFLDSFALICSTEKNGARVSAACLEEGSPQGTVIRVASNEGVTEHTLGELRGIVGVLNAVAGDASAASCQQIEILSRIIRLDYPKIQHYVKKLRAEAKAIGEYTAIMEPKAADDNPYLRKSLEWLMPFLRAIQEFPESPKHHTSQAGIDLLRAAHEGKQFLEATRSGNPPLPWVRVIKKLARYFVASKVMTVFASEFPALFNPMVVESVRAPPRIAYSSNRELRPLTSVLRRTVSIGREEYYRSRLAAVWNTKDPETHFRQACSIDLVAHAELQLLNFYDHRPFLRPHFPYIGVSKKSCYLCSMFISMHHGKFTSFSCHKKLYVSWIPPPTVNDRVYRQYKEIVTKLAKHMEDAATYDLEHRLGHKRAIFPADSTAGVSSSGLTGLWPRENSSQPSAESQKTTAMNQVILRSEAIAPPSPVIESESPLHIAGAAASVESPARSDVNNALRTASPVRYMEEDADQRLKMVFHFTRGDNPSRQEIIQMADILDFPGGDPSWAKMIEILNADSLFRVSFEEGRDFLVVNDRIRVTNERQFRACVQLLCNNKIWNSDVLVRRIDMLRS